MSEQKSPVSEKKPSRILQFFRFVNDVKVILLTLLVLILIGIIAYLGWKISNAFEIEPVHVTDFQMNNMHAYAQSQLIVGNFKGVVHHEYKIEYKIKIGGQLFDSPFGIGNRSVAVNDTMTIPFGYDFKQHDRLFSDSARGKIIETKDSLILKVVTDFPVPRRLGYDIKTFPDISNSILTGKITKEEFYGELDSLAGEYYGPASARESDFMRNAYAQSLADILNQVLGILSVKGKATRLELIVNGTPYVPGVLLPKDLENMTFPKNQTVITIIQ